MDHGSAIVFFCCIEYIHYSYVFQAFVKVDQFYVSSRRVGRVLFLGEPAGLSFQDQAQRSTNVSLAQKMAEPFLN